MNFGMVFIPVLENLSKNQLPILTKLIKLEPNSISNNTNLTYDIIPGGRVAWARTASTVTGPRFAVTGPATATATPMTAIVALAPATAGRGRAGVSWVSSWSAQGIYIRTQVVPSTSASCFGAVRVLRHRIKLSSWEVQDYPPPQSPG